MPFDPTPSQSTYQNKQLAVFYTQNNRNSSSAFDEDYQNCFMEIIQNRELGHEDKVVVKRSGSEQYIASVGAGEVRGMHYNEDFRKLYYCVGTTMYVWNVETNVISATLTSFFTGSTGRVGFCDFYYESGATVIIATDGTELRQISATNVVTNCVDADLPTHQPNPVFLDGYIFVVKANTNDIYNSVLDNPLSWDASNFISAEIDADLSQNIFKLNNYLVVFGTKTIEYFYDAGTATGSPLGRNDTPVKLVGSFIGAAASHGNQIFFCGSSLEDQPAIYMLEDFNIKLVSDASLQRYLTSITTDPYVNWEGNIVSTQGHTFYVLNAGTQTYAIDIDTKYWARWAYQNTTVFPLTFARNSKNSTTYQSFFSLAGGTTVYRFRPTIYQDVGVNFTVSGTTSNEYFGTYNQKYMSRLTAWTDKPSGSSLMSVSWSDDDYQTFSTPVTFDLYQERPNINRLGRFRRRAFKWEYTDNFPFRLKGIEVNINMGQH